MAISINWATQVISVPQAYLTNLGGGIYELDVDQFRLDLKDIEDNADGIVFLKTHNHNTQVTLSGTLFARSFEVINGYTIEFENGSYSVKCVGANHNIGDVKVVNSVSLIIGNSAGMVVNASSLTAGDKADIAAAVLDEMISSHTTPGSLGDEIKKKLSLTQFIGLKD